MSLPSISRAGVSGMFVRVYVRINCAFVTNKSDDQVYHYLYRYENETRENWWCVYVRMRWRERERDERKGM